MRWKAHSALLGLFPLLCPLPGAADLGGEPATLHALVGARIVTAPGSEPFTGIVVIRDGRFDLVARDGSPPTGAIVHDLTGRTLYAGAVDPYRVLPAPEADDASGPALHPNPRVRSEVRALDQLDHLSNDEIRNLQEAGYAIAQLVPSPGVFRGRAAVVTLADGPAAVRVLAGESAQAVAFAYGSWNSQEVPASLMGSVAVIRQTLLDAQWVRDVRAAAERSPLEVDRPVTDVSLDALAPVLSATSPMLLETRNVQELWLATSLAREFGVDLVVMSLRPDHYQREAYVPRWLQAADASLITTLDFPPRPDLDDAAGDEDLSLASLEHWDRAPTDPARLEAMGIPFAVTSHGLDSPADVLPRLRRAIRHGLSERAALASLTTEPARILGIADRAGTIEPGRDAHLIVATGDLFAPGTRVEAVWIDGRRFGEAPRAATQDDLAHEWELFAPDAPDSILLAVELKRDEARLTGTARNPGADPDGKASSLQALSFARGVLSLTMPAAVTGTGARSQVELQRDGPFLRGTRDGVPVRARTKPPEPPEFLPPVSLDASPWPPEADLDAAPAVVLVRGGTVWTEGEAGTLENADVLVRNGSIVAVGPGLEAPDDALVVDATGMHVTPGLINAHAHSAIRGGSNECTESCTAEVRVADVVDDRAAAIYRDLAGGLTASHQMHGSCNPIGGQTQLIKLRWGQPAEELLLRGAMPGIKFALGENVIRAGWDEAKARDRYPNTRMGVDQFLRERLFAAEAYRRRWEEWRSGARATPPRRDLELDALIEVLDGDRIVHCHAYRADEMLMLMRVAEDFGFRVGAFHHALEAYQVANELADHGAGVSAFADYWLYKIETAQGIPYNGPLCHERGVLVSYNSDSADRSRRMNQEASRAARWGPMDDADALAFVTRNPAQQLGVGDRVGRLEVGMDADFVLWSARPLSTAAVCQQTWVDGVKRFDIKEDQAARSATREERARLLAKVRSSKELGKKEADPSAGEAGEHAEEYEAGVCTGAWECGGEQRR